MISDQTLKDGLVLSCCIMGYKTDPVMDRPVSPPAFVSEVLEKVVGT